MEKRYSKLKLFLLLVFSIVAIVFVTQLIKFFNSGITTIEQKKKEVTCSNMRYSITDINYKDNVLSFILESKTPLNITSFTVISDTNQSYTNDIFLKRGDSTIISIDNINLKNSIKTYANNCYSIKTTTKIR